MTIENESWHESPSFSRLDELAWQTKRYSIREIDPGQFEVMDNRHLLNRLLQFPELRPGTDNLPESQLDELLGQLSPGPTLDLRDMLILGWLMMRVEEIAEETENASCDAYDNTYDDACLLRGTFRQVEYFLLAALDHRVQ
jgi:hypothetical protein